MTPAARLQAAIEILDEVIAAARDDGPPADILVTRYFKMRRYAGSSDRRAVRELVFRAIRRSAERPESGRAAMLGLAQDDCELLELFGQVRGQRDHDGGCQPPRGSPRGWRPLSRPKSRARNGRRCSSVRRSTSGSMSRAPDGMQRSASFRARYRLDSVPGDCGCRPIPGSTTIPPLSAVWSRCRMRGVN